MLSACNFPTTFTPVAGNVSAWIDAPLDGSHLALAPYEVVYHGAAPAGIEKVELRINGDLVAVQESFNPLQQIFTFHFKWQPIVPGNYTLIARTQDTNGDWGDDAVAEVIIDEAIGEANEQREDATPTPETAAVPALVSCEPSATFIMDANCRSGPSLGHDILTSTSAGQTALIVGQNQSSSWWNIQLPGTENTCWVSGTTVETTCLSDKIPQISFPPLINTPTMSTNDFHWGDCDLRKVTIQADVFSDTLISYVEIHFRIKQQSWSVLEMQNIGDRTYSITLNSRDDIPGAMDQISSPLWYYFIAMDTSGLFSQSETYQNINLSKCP